MLILPGVHGSTRKSMADRRDPALILADLLASLDALDAVGASLAAAHLSLAIETLRSQFDLGEDSSGTD